MKYKQLVDDIQIQFKSHNESVKTQNPYWILFRIVSEINAIRDQLIKSFTDISQVPEWMIEKSPVIIGTLSNSGNVPSVVDTHKFAEFKLPDAYPIFNSRGILDIKSEMRQKQIFLEDIATTILRIQADDDNLEFYHYGYLETNKLTVYPFLEKIYVQYIPNQFGISYDEIKEEDEIVVPEFIISEARKRVVESVIIQKQIPEDDRSDQRDGSEPANRQNRQ